MAPGEWWETPDRPANGDGPDAPWWAAPADDAPTSEADDARTPSAPAVDDIPHVPDPPSYDTTAEDATSASLGLVEAVTGFFERMTPAGDEGEPDWSRLQLAKNGFGIAVALIPFGGQSFASLVGDAIATYSVNIVFALAGYVLLPVGAIWLGAYAPGPFGLILTLARNAITSGALLLWNVMTSRLGWLVVRPAIWSIVLGALIVVWRATLYVLTGA